MGMLFLREYTHTLSVSLTLSVSVSHSLSLRQCFLNKRRQTLLKMVRGTLMNKI